MVNKMKKSFSLCLAAGVILSAVISQYLIYFYAPMEQTLGLAQKIFYYHLPVAWWAFVSFFFAALFGGFYLFKKEQCFNILSHANAEVGFLLATLTLITGSLWGKHSWGVWWTWDPKLTTALILWFIFASYLIVILLSFIPAARDLNRKWCTPLFFACFLLFSYGFGW